jgi:hypothetical protein
VFASSDADVAVRQTGGRMKCLSRRDFDALEATVPIEKRVLDLNELREYGYQVMTVNGERYNLHFDGDVVPFTCRFCKK